MHGRSAPDSAPIVGAVFGRRASVIDHVLGAVRDFREAASWWLSEHGLVAVEGGRHAGWGTAYWIVPLGEAYVELVGVADEALAAQSWFGRRAKRALDEDARFYAWCVAPTDFDGTVARLGLTPTPGSRVRPDGEVIRWRTAGTDVALADPSRPFFIAWDVADALHPGRAGSTPGHGHETTGIAWIEVSGDESLVREWLGDSGASVRVRAGSPAIRRIGIATEAGEIVIE